MRASRRPGDVSGTAQGTVCSPEAADCCPAGTSSHACCESRNRASPHEAQHAQGQEVQQPEGTAGAVQTPSFLPVCLAAVCPTQFVHLPAGAHIACAPSQRAVVDNTAQPQPLADVNIAEASSITMDEGLDGIIVSRIAEDVPERISRRGVL